MFPKSRSELLNSGLFIAEKMKALERPINVNTIARKIDVDNRITLRNYYRIADNLLRQANIYREEKNIVDLYIILLRYSSLVSETIPFHRDYQVLHAKEKPFYKKKLFSVIDELESLKPEFHRRVNELNKAHAAQQRQFDGLGRTAYGSGSTYSILDIKQPTSPTLQSSWNRNNNHTQALSSSTLQIDKQLQKLSLLPVPNKETLSRHSFLGPNGLRGQWLGPSADIKVQYPSNTDLTITENSGLNQAGQYSLEAVNGGDSAGDSSTMASVLSLDDGRWPRSSEESCTLLNNGADEDNFQLGNIRQPSPPPVLAQMKEEVFQISPSKVADPRPGPAKPSQDGIASSSSYQHLYIPVKMMDDFLRLARENTAKNLETCGVLAGSLKNKIFHISTLIIPKQESTSDSCQTLNEEEIFEVQDKLSLFPLGWIHTHPSQTCFMSSVDLHTHYSYQIMLPEAVAIVMAPTDESSPYGIFHLSDPSGVSVIRNCQERGFHPHEEPSDGNPIYEHCSHVYINPNMKFDVLDLR